MSAQKREAVLRKPWREPLISPTHPHVDPVAALLRGRPVHTPPAQLYSLPCSRLTHICPALFPPRVLSKQPLTAHTVLDAGSTPAREKDMVPILGKEIVESTHRSDPRVAV